jgi:hypothetical protein
MKVWGMRQVAVSRAPLAIAISLAGQPGAPLWHDAGTLSAITLSTRARRAPADSPEPAFLNRL